MFEEENNKLKKLLAEKRLISKCIKRSNKKNSWTGGQGGDESYYKISKKLWHEGEEVKGTVWYSSKQSLWNAKKRRKIIKGLKMKLLLKRWSSLHMSFLSVAMREYIPKGKQKLWHTRRFLQNPVNHKLAPMMVSKKVEKIFSPPKYLFFRPLKSH